MEHLPEGHLAFYVLVPAPDAPGMLQEVEPHLAELPLGQTTVLVGSTGEELPIWRTIEF